MEEFNSLFDKCTPAFKQSRSHHRARELAYGLLNCLGRRTLSGIITASGKQFVDWSCSYRLFRKDNMDIDKIFSVIRERLINEELKGEDNNIYAHMDDTLIKKRGLRVSGASWFRDPLGPRFQTNFIWGQRFLQLSISLPEKEGISRSRAIPVDMRHCPTVKKPGKNATEEELKKYKEEKKETNLSLQGVSGIEALRNNVDNQGGRKRNIVLSVDGSYTNRNVMRNLPERVILIGRIRKDTRLNEAPGKSEKTGRKRIYGKDLPSPEEIRRSEEYPWQEIKAYAAGKVHNFQIKIVENLRWRKAGNRNLKLIIIRPLAYRLTKGARLLYRNPAYLICTSPELEIEKLLQAYLWRWEIEVNFRDEKTLLGCGQAQIRKKQPVEKVPAFIVAVYAMLLLASQKVDSRERKKQLPETKWYKKTPCKRTTTGDLLNLFRLQLWAKNMNISFDHFVNLQHLQRTHKNYADPAFSSIFYCRN